MSSDDLKRLLQTRIPTTSYVGTSGGSLRGGKVSVQTEIGIIRATVLGSLQPGACWVFKGSDGNWYAAGKQNRIVSDRVIVHRHSSPRPKGFLGEAAVLFAKLKKIGPGEPPVDCACPRYSYIDGKIIKACGGAAPTPYEAAATEDAVPSKKTFVTVFLSRSGDFWDPDFEVPARHNPQKTIKGVGYGYGAAANYQYISPDTSVKSWGFLGLPPDAAVDSRFTFRDNPDSYLREFGDPYYRRIWTAHSGLIGHYRNWLRIAGYMYLGSESEDSVAPQSPYQSSELVREHERFFVAPIEGSYLEAGSHAIAFLELGNLDTFKEGLDEKTGTSWIVQYVVTPLGDILEPSDLDGGFPLPPVEDLPAMQYEIEFWLGGDRPPLKLPLKINATEIFSTHLVKGRDKVFIQINCGLRNDITVPKDAFLFLRPFNLSNTNRTVDFVSHLGEDGMYADGAHFASYHGFRENPEDSSSSIHPTKWCRSKNYTVFPSGAILSEISSEDLEKNWQRWWWTDSFLLSFSTIPYMGSFPAYVLALYDIHYKRAIDTYDLNGPESFFLEAATPMGLSPDVTCFANVQCENEVVSFYDFNADSKESIYDNWRHRVVEKSSYYATGRYGVFYLNYPLRAKPLLNLQENPDDVRRLGLNSSALNKLKTQNTDLSCFFVPPQNFKRKKGALGIDDLEGNDPFHGYFPNFFDPSIILKKFGSSIVPYDFTPPIDKRSFVLRPKSGFISYNVNADPDLWEMYKHHPDRDLYVPKFESTLRAFDGLPPVEALEGHDFRARFPSQIQTCTEFADFREDVIVRKKVKALSLEDSNAVILAISIYARGVAKPRKDRPFYIRDY